MKTPTWNQKTPCRRSRGRSVMKNHCRLHFLPVLALAALLVQIRESKSLQPRLTGPDSAFLNSRVAFRCFAASSSKPITYELMRDGGYLIGTHADEEGDQTAQFFLKVTGASDGSYQCKVEAGGSTGVSNSIRLRVVTPASNTRVTSEPAPPVAYEGSRIVLSCVVSKGSHLSYSWFFNRREVTSSTSEFNMTGNKLLMKRVTPEHAGNYYCIAWSTVQSVRRFSTSREIQVSIKVYVAKPQISFSIFKDGGSYYGNVTCRSSKGSPPVDFSLSLDEKVVGSATAAETLAAWFSVAMVPGLDMGDARCRVKTEMQDLRSEPVTLVVVPVGGLVKVEVEYLYSANASLAAAKLTCRISRGSFPRVSWVFNHSDVVSDPPAGSHWQPLPPPFAVADGRRSLLLTRLSPEQSGYYHCRARDSYDDSGPWVQSNAVLVPDWTASSMLQTASFCETPELSVTPAEVIIMVFCCFFALMLLVGSVCVYVMREDERAHGSISPENSAALHLSEPESLPADLLLDVLPSRCDVHNQTAEITV